MPARIVIRDGRVLTPMGMIEPGAVIVEEGRIVGVAEKRCPAEGKSGYIDARDRLVMPGLVDLHNDGLEKEISPRPGVRFPVAWALSNYDRRLAACGITTEFHAVYFADLGGVRTVEGALETARFIEDSLGDALYAVDHRVLYRMEIGCRAGMEAVASCLGGSAVPYLSVNEHVPGRGQYRRLGTPREMVLALRDDLAGGEDSQEIIMIEERINGWMRNGMDHLKKIIPSIVERYGAVVASHDDDTPEKVRYLHSLGASLCEFPVTVEAAREARRIGMWVAAGATNVMRGGSLSGNVSAEELVLMGLVDIMCSDYYAPALLGAVFKLSRDGVMGLKEAHALASANPARAVGLEGVGAIEEGFRADVVIVDGSRGMPSVEMVLREGRLVYSTGRLTVKAVRGPAEEVGAHGSGEALVG